MTDVSLIANQLFRRLLYVPFIAKFIVFARSPSQTQTRLRIFCATDDKLDKTLERRQNYDEVARSQHVEVCTSSRSLTSFHLFSASAFQSWNRVSETVTDPGPDPTRDASDP